MAALNKFNAFVEDLSEKVHNLGTDVLKVCLTNTLPVNTNTILANITQIAAGNGYTAGGSTASVVTSAQTGGIYKLVLNDVVFTAAGGPLPAFRYVVLYNSTAAGGPLIGWYDYGSSITPADTETFTTDFDQAAGVLTLQ